MSIRALHAVRIVWITSTKAHRHILMIGVAQICMLVAGDTYNLSFLEAIELELAKVLEPNLSFSIFDTCIV